MYRNAETVHSLQISRAVAALLVVMHHAAQATKDFLSMPDLIYDLLNLGRFGVDYFFVLSGFIIAYSTQKLKPTLRDARKYMMSRGIRIYIPYLPISLSMIAVLLLLPSLSQSTRDGFSWIGSLFLLPSNAGTALAVAWSLQYEMIFYILFGVCFFAFKNIRYIYLWLIPILIVLLFFEVPRWVNFLVGIRNVEFLFGVAAYQLFIAQRFFRYRYCLVALGLISVATFCALYLRQEIALAIYPLCGFGFACILLGIAYIERHIDFSQYRIFAFLGAASYSIYLMHGPAMSVLVRLFSFVLDWYFLYVLLVIASCITAILYYKWIETPLMAWAKSKVR